VAFVVGVGLVLGGLLGYARASIVAETATQAHAQTVADTGAALQAGINDVRTSGYNYDNGDGNCFGGATPGTTRYYDAGAGSGAWSASASVSTRYLVTCAPGPGTGAAAGLTVQNSSTRPGSAILTLGTDPGEPGVGVASNGTLTVKGRVVSNSSITRGGSSSVLSSPWAQVKATGTCNTSYVVSIPAALCSYTPTAADAAAFADPTQYAAPVPTPNQLTPRTVPACSAGGTVTLQPGYYDDAVALTAISSCGMTVIFAPGTYWFDFHNSEMPSSGPTAVPPGSDVWTVGNRNTHLIGGTPAGWSSGPPPAFPGACISPLLNQTAQGVRFVFGGDSRMNVTAGKVELCGTYSSSSPPIVLTGATSGADTSYSGAQGTATSVATPSGASAFGPAGQVVAGVSAADSSYATVTVPRPSSGTSAAGMTLSGFATSPAVPPGSVLTGATLVVRHREQTTRSGDGLALTVTPARSGAAAVTPSIGLNSSSGFRTDSVDLTAALVAEAHTYGLSGLQVRYDVTVGRAAGSNTSLTADVDAVQLVLAFKPPAVRGERTAINGTANCVGTAPYVPASSNCALLTTSGAQTAVYLQGTTYTPQAALDVSLTNVSRQVFRSGVVVRSLRIGITPSAGYSGPVIEIPDDSTGPQPLDVYVTAYRCPDGATCPAPAVGASPGAPWRLAGRAAASFADGGATPRTVTVKAWQIVR
jgi:hypothetical protein